MEYPSKDIRDWCININKFFKILNNNSNIRSHYESTLCACGIERAIQFCPSNQQKDLVNGLFWSIWIDQVFYYVTKDGGIKPYLRNNFKSINNKLYDKFRKIYPFPKIHAHTGGGQINPVVLLDDNLNYKKPTNNLLLEGKKSFWGEIKSWLKSIKREDIIDQMIKAFRDDIYERFGKEYEFLVQKM